MEKKLFTVDQVAGTLELHPKTVRRFIREGRLKAQKVGGQWRVLEEDMHLFMKGEKEVRETSSDHIEAFTGFHSDSKDGTHKTASTPEERPKERIQVSSVIDIFVACDEEAERLSNSLLAVMNTDDPDLRGARMNYFYYKQEKRARFMIWGKPIFASKILEIISMLAR